jgi:transcriptional regulator with GAF, ATPase, and Fis domain
MGARLIVVAGPLPRTELVLDEAESLIGRDPDADIPLSSRAASRRHCLVVRAGDQYLVRDLGSHNGTLVNGVPINERVLENGDQITVVDSVFAFVRDGRETAFRPEVTEISDGNAVEFSRVQLAETIYRNPPRLLAEAEAAKLGGQLKALLDINRKAATSRDPEDLQQVLLDAAFQLTPAERAAVLLYEQLDVTASSMMGQHRSARRTAAIPVSQTVVRRVLAEKVTVLARDVVAEEAFKNIHSLAASGSRSILCVPLLSRDRCLGVLYLDIQNPTLEFDDGHLETLTSVAAVVGLSLENALDFQRMRAQAALLRAALEQDRAMVGESPAMKAIYECIAKVAPSDTTVLILGDSGTGKEVVARAIHSNSRRSDKPFVAVNCATLGENLLESELFGHEKGAFTGAVSMKKGLLEVADGGTILLDEVAELPLTVQAKLLRVLQEREFTRLGSTRSMRVNLRVLAATNKDLRAAVAAGAFREDLWHRLNVISIKLAPLRERAEDIPLLANFFLARASQHCGRRVLGISAEARAFMQQYDWPGNVRELDNAIERAVVLGSEPEIQLNDLPETVWEGAPCPSGALTYHAALREAKQKIVSQALEATGGNYTEAARRLGVHVTYLHRLMRSFKMKAAAMGECT